ncbi:MAG: transcription-repair coupling factor [Actinomycetota bacterium]|nr:transcription-repair coupling factor [Actinomycetota bacterium]
MPEYNPVLMDVINAVAGRMSGLISRLRDGEGALFAVKAEEEVHAFAAARIFEELGGPLLAVVPGREAEEELTFLLAGLFGDGAVRPLPFRELVIAGERGEDPEAVALRARALRSLVAGEDTVVICEARALAQSFPTQPRVLAPLRFRVGAEMDMGDAAVRLVEMGYGREYLVEGAGQFSVRGGIMDVYDPGWSRPVRVEFLGDQVERIRHFNPVDQRSGERREEVEVFPVVLPATGGKESGLLELLPPSAVVLSLQPLAVGEKLRALGLGTSLRERAEAGGLALVEFDPMPHRPLYGIPASAPAEYRGHLGEFIADLGGMLGEGWKVSILLETEGRVDRMRQVLVERGLSVSTDDRARPGVVLLGRGNWSRGVRLTSDRMALFTERDIFGRLRPRAAAASRPASGQPVEGWWDLEEGDYVVHVNHGIAVYGGLVEREVDGAIREYLILRYGGGDVLYVPTDRIDLVHRYVGAEKPGVHRLSSHHWRRATRKARSSVKEMAFDLLKLYADRMAGEGHSFASDDVWQRELEGSFPFVETPDQERAIEEVKEDMERSVSMDRLVYGDVGYGKTEVAVRAAFKAIMGGKQVAVLVPTTVLAQQHYRTFSDRFAPFPVRLETLSRFRGAVERREVLEGLASGEVDMVIGTHRILQGDVLMADLGLVIVDEEHRFGVAQKERLKALRRSVDVLTLTATPIPRTLQMSLSGIRDMSVIDTPIEDRHAVITSVGPYDEELVREAVMRELRREGQVFYVHNRVQTIERAARRVRELVPEAGVVVGHGQMRERKLEQVMDDFIEHRADVLVCTTIVESGLDIPNVNTLIVDGAENLGLSQLYHLRGRIGRSDRQALAFFLFREGGTMTGGALRRLKVIRDFSELGSGLRVAMKDLEIRGAGNLLGPEQHGHVEAVGFELYCRMLAEAVDTLRGVSQSRTSEVTIDLPLRALIPEDYISRASRRVEIYRRLAEAGKREGVHDLSDEVRDRYGPLPAEAENLFAVALLRLACMKAGVREISHEKENVVIRLGFEGAKRYDEILQRALRGEYAWSGAFYRKTLQEIVLEECGDGRAVEGREYLRQLTVLLDAIV